MLYDSLIDKFKDDFIEKDRWKWVLEGLRNTLLISMAAVLIGIVIGILIATVRTTYDKNGPSIRMKSPVAFFFLRVGNFLAHLYLTVIRGTPVVVQLLIMYFLVFASASDGVMVAIFAFGINSGAYVAEIFRSGIMSVDEGQFEAGRAMGLSYLQTMIYIIIPQCFKTVLPTLCNEFIVLLKETSIAGYVGIMDLTKAGDLIRGRTFDAFLPLIVVALLYLIMVVVLTKLVGRLERRLRKNERGA
ncbi:MAG: amino acid ABC transporter permease [Clostridia bacterium]|nr:amino acid ABC transporter permease [Clostridia bacterium]